MCVAQSKRIRLVDEQIARRYQNKTGINRNKAFLNANAQYFQEIHTSIFQKIKHSLY